MNERTTLYWDKPGPANTEATVECALVRVRALGVKHLVFASNTGWTAEAVLARTDPDELNLVCVTHHVGYRSPGDDEMPPAVREKLVARGVRVLTTTHLFANVERAVTRQFGGLYPGGIISHTLRMFGQGTKVCVEVAVMALDAGLIPYGEEIVTVAGTGRGADTALVLRPAHAADFFRTDILEVICKPRLPRTGEGTEAPRGGAKSTG